MDIELLITPFLEALKEEIISRYSFDADQKITINLDENEHIVYIEATWTGTEIPVLPCVEMSKSPQPYITVDSLVDL